MFTRTTAINKLLAMKARIKVVQGGTSAGKTYGIIPCIIDYATKHPRIRITIVAESVPALRDGAVRIFKDVMYDTGRWIEGSWISNPMEYTFGNGAIIQFKSFDSIGKAKASGKRELLFLNEANHIDYEIADALMIRSLETWIDFNPDNEFWAHTEVLTQPNSEFLLLTYKDNEAIPPETLQDLIIKLSKAFHDPQKEWKGNNVKSEYWANWCRVYIAGEIGNLQGCIYQNWIEGQFDDSLPFLYGQDFGFSNDPDTLLKVAIDKKRNKIYAKEVMYSKGQSTGVLVDRMKGLIESNQLIVADSADPRTIEDLRLSGFNVVPATKGQDSIRSGIKRIQEYEIIVHPESHNLKKELRHYMWHDKKSETPIDEWNHLLDPLRYAFDELCPLNQFFIV